MKIISMTCPKCGGELSIDKDSINDFCFCSYCGEKLFVEDNVIRTEHKETIEDLGRIKEAEIEIEKSKNETIYLIALLVVVVIILLIM